jgi:hypothetical protein
MAQKVLLSGPFFLALFAPGVEPAERRSQKRLGLAIRCPSSAQRQPK